MTTNGWRACALVAALAACGGEATTLTDDAPDVIEGAAALQADNNFGYDDGNHYQACGSISPVGTCYYPFGFGDGDDADNAAMWTVCVNSGGMSLAQLNRTATAINAVIAELEPHGVSLEVTRVGACDSGQLIHIVKGSVTSEGVNPIRSYGRTSCQSSFLLGESPAIDGLHRTCYRHKITLDLNDLDAAWGTGQHGYTHVMGSLLGMVTLGVGLSSLPAHDLRWSSAIRTGHTKLGFDFATYCRASTAAYTLLPQFINKPDTNCD